MSAIQSNMASILFTSYSAASATHGANCNCASCAAGSSSTGAASTGNSNTAATSGAAKTQGASTSSNTGQAASAATPLSSSGQPLSKSQQDQVDEMKKTDAAVRRHEQAHLSAAGGYARSGIVLNFKVGPDGKQYAVGGHVDIDTSPVKGNPAATVAKMETVQRAALAPADPSGQDVRVAAEAGQEANKARAEEAQQQQQAASPGGASGVAGAGTGGANPGGAVAGSAASRQGGKLSLSISAAYAKSISAASTPSGDSSFSGQLLDVVG